MPVWNQVTGQVIAVDADQAETFIKNNRIEAAQIEAERAAARARAAAAAKARQDANRQMINQHRLYESESAYQGTGNDTVGSGEIQGPPRYPYYEGTTISPTPTLGDKIWWGVDKYSHEIPLTNYLDAAFGKNIINGQPLTKEERIERVEIGLQQGLDAVYSTYMMNGVKIVGPSIPVNSVGETFVPDEYWQKKAPDNYTPGSKIDHYRQNPDTGVIEKSKVIYDDYGRQQYRIDYSDHGMPNDHTSLHLHERKFNDIDPTYDPIKGKEFLHNLLP